MALVTRLLGEPRGSTGYAAPPPSDSADQEQPRRNHLIQPIHMFWQRAIGLSLDDQQIGLQSLHRVVQGVASDGSHDTPFNFDIVPGKGAGQVFQPRFDVSCKAVQRTIAPRRRLV